MENKEYDTVKNNNGEILTVIVNISRKLSNKLVCNFGMEHNAQLQYISALMAVDQSEEYMEALRKLYELISEASVGNFIQFQIPKPDNSIKKSVDELGNECFKTNQFYYKGNKVDLKYYKKGDKNKAFLFEVPIIVIRDEKSAKELIDKSRNEVLSYGFTY